MKNNKYEIDMVNGSIMDKLISFALPLMISGILQLAFNAVDIIVVGQFSGSKSLAAVGSTTALINVFVNLFMGISLGANVLAARFYAAGKDEEMSKTVHTSIMIALISGIVMGVVGVIFARGALEIMGTPDDVIGLSTIYMRIYFCGMPFFMLYNYGAAILRAVGDTKRPLIFLIISGCINALLNLFFVIVCRLGVIGVAIASIIAQYISAALIIRFLMKTYGSYGLRMKDIAIDRDAAAAVLRIGVPAAIQYSLFAIANICIQTSINSFSHVVVEGNSAATNADSLIYDMMAAFYTACTSFIAQNLGARKKERVLRTFFITLAYSFLMGLVLGVALFIFQRPFLLLFTSDDAVIHYGQIRIGVMAFVYCVSAFMDNATAAARGIGKSVMPTIIVVMGSVVFRIIWLLTVFAYFKTLQSLYLIYVISWTLTAIAGNIYFAYHYRRI